MFAIPGIYFRAGRNLIQVQASNAPRLSWGRRSMRPVYAAILSVFVCLLSTACAKEPHRRCGKREHGYKLPTGTATFFAITPSQSPVNGAGGGGRLGFPGLQAWATEKE
jgi:hypothetical protein